MNNKIYGKIAHCRKNSVFATITFILLGKFVSLTQIILIRLLYQKFTMYIHTSNFNHIYMILHPSLSVKINIASCKISLGLHKECFYFKKIKYIDNIALTVELKVLNIHIYWMRRNIK